MEKCYRSSDNINFLDGDKESSVAYKSYTHFDGNEASYKEDATKAYFSMIDDRARVYKGGSWKDRAYWMSPGTRRFLDERQSTSYIGFRCAMARVGSPVGLGTSKKRQ
jgi:sulfatase modifying factor 1